MFNQKSGNIAHLVGVFEHKVGARFTLHEVVDDAAQDTPGIVHVEVDLCRKVRWTELVSAQDRVVRGVLRVHARHKAVGIEMCT